MRSSVFCSVCLIVFVSGSSIKAQPVATEFRNPVLPVDQSLNGYYNANPFLSYTPKHGYHTGEDWNGNGKGSTDYGDPVYPTAVGKVVKVFNPTQKHSWGKTVIIQHLLPDGRVIYSLYAHLSKISVRLNQIVWSDKPLGNIGDANGYYKGVAHLHFELRRVNDWTPKSPGYYKTLTIADAKKYLDPSLFIDDRSIKISVPLYANSVFSASEAGVEISEYTPASLSYVTCSSKSTSFLLSDAHESAIYVDSSGIGRRILDFFNGIIVFGPGIDFSFESFRECTLTVVLPGNNFQASRTRDDMIEIADHAGFTVVKLETLKDIKETFSGPYNYWSLCFDRGIGTAVGCIIHATHNEHPIVRWVKWYEPETDKYLGSWHGLDP